jgi:Enoyl-CoA hydratase/isomerase
MLVLEPIFETDLPSELYALARLEAMKRALSRQADRRDAGRSSCRTGRQQAGASLRWRWGRRHGHDLQRENAVMPLVESKIQGFVGTICLTISRSATRFQRRSSRTSSKRSML